MGVVVVVPMGGDSLRRSGLRGLRSTTAVVSTSAALGCRCGRLGDWCWQFATSLGEEEQEGEIDRSDDREDGSSNGEGDGQSGGVGNDCLSGRMVCLGLNDMVVVVVVSWWAAHLRSAGKACSCSCCWWWCCWFEENEEEDPRRLRWALANCHSAGNTSADPVAECWCRLAGSATLWTTPPWTSMILCRWSILDSCIKLIDD
jgi:hypothetical protein